MKSLLIIVAICFAGCSASYTKTINDAFEKCKQICPEATTDISGVCFDKDKTPLCLCFEKGK